MADQPLLQSGNICPSPKVMRQAGTVLCKYWTNILEVPITVVTLPDTPEITASRQMARSWCRHHQGNLRTQSMVPEINRASSIFAVKNSLPHREVSSMIIVIKAFKGSLGKWQKQRLPVTSTIANPPSNGLNGGVLISSGCSHKITQTR